MAPVIYRYRFDERVPLQDVEETLFLGVLAAEGLHGVARVAMDASHALDKERRACAIDATSDVGRDLARIFTSLLLHEFGPDAFRVEAVEMPHACRTTEACARASRSSQTAS